VESFIDAVGDLLTGLFALANVGFDGVNQVVGLVIAVLAALMMVAWRSLWATAAGATLVHILVEALRPALDGGDFLLPDVLSVGFWVTAFALFLGYSIVIAVMFFLKTLITGSAFRRHSHA
jgi:hypothetical protein